MPVNPPKAPSIFPPRTAAGASAQTRTKPKRRRKVAGMNVLLFLTPEDRVPHGFAIVGFSQGKLTVANNGLGQPVASQNLSALNLQSRTGTVAPGRSRTILLSELRQKIQQTLAGADPGSSARR